MEKKRVDFVKSLQKSLLKKKWHKEEISKALRTLERTKPKHLDSAVFLIAIIVSVIGNFLISISLLPLLLLADGVGLALILILVGICFGILFESLICGLGKTSKHHHVISGIFIPVIALLNTVLIINLSNKFINVMHISASPHFLSLSLVYVFASMIPFTVHKIMLKKKMMSE